MKTHRYFLAEGSRRISGSVIFLILMLSFSSFAGNEDSLKSKYDINDPRNPKCPCHKYQKLADEEYKQLLSKLNKDQKRTDDIFAVNNPPSANVTGTASNRQLSGGDDIKKKRSLWGEKFKGKKRIKKHTRWQKLKESVHRGFWKRHPNADSCFKWRK
jgi:hypothetical protein